MNDLSSRVPPEPAARTSAAQARLDSRQGAHFQGLWRDARADAQPQSEYGLRRGGVPQHRRMLDQEARHGDDPGRRLHARLRLLQRQDRHAARRSMRHEPAHVAEAAAKLGLEHIVITSVDRDDLPDGGAGQFVKVIAALRAATPADDDRDPHSRFPGQDARPRSRRSSRRGPTSTTTISKPCRGSIRRFRPGARYYASLRLLEQVKQHDPSIFTKFGRDARDSARSGSKSTR